jgi:hypothetical protein
VGLAKVGVKDWVVRAVPETIFDHSKGVLRKLAFRTATAGFERFLFCFLCERDMNGMVSKKNPKGIIPQQGHISNSVLHFSSFFLALDTWFLSSIDYARASYQCFTNMNNKFL